MNASQRRAGRDDARNNDDDDYADDVIDVDEAVYLQRAREFLVKSALAGDGGGGGGAPATGGYEEILKRNALMAEVSW